MNRRWRESSWNVSYNCYTYYVVESDHLLLRIACSHLVFVLPATIDACSKSTIDHQHCSPPPSFRCKRQSTFSRRIPQSVPTTSILGAHREHAVNLASCPRCSPAYYSVHFLPSIYQSTNLESISVALFTFLPNWAVQV